MSDAQSVPSDPVLAALQRLEQSLSNIGIRLDRIETGQEGYRIDAVLRGQYVEQMRVDMMERMDRLQNTMTAIRDDIGVNFAASDAVKRANDNTREELRALNELVTAMYRKLTSLETRVREITGDP